MVDGYRDDTVDAHSVRAFHGMNAAGQRCRCYVRFILDAHILFGLRLGAHEPRCPVYRISADPLDRADDKAWRDAARITAPQTFDMGTDASPLGGGA